MNAQLSSVCIITDGEAVSSHMAEEIETLVTTTDVEVSLIAIDETSSKNENSKSDSVFHQAKKFTVNILNGRASYLYYAESEFAQKILPWETMEEKIRTEFKDNKVNLDSIHGLDNTNRIYFTPNKVGDYTYELPDNIVDSIIHKTDITVLIGFNKILRGRILTEPEYGTLSFHGSDIRRYRGRPGGFWQFLNDEEVIGCTLQQLTNELDGGNIVVCRHGNISDSKTLWDVRYRRYRLHGTILSEGIQNLQDPNFELIELSEDNLGQLTYQQSKEVWSNALRILIKNVRGRYLKK